MPPRKPISPHKSVQRKAIPAEAPLAEQCIHSLIRSDGLLRRHGETRLAQFGVSPCQWGILRALQRNEAAGNPPPKMMELGEMLLVQPPSLSATIDRMSRTGIVTRIDDAHDHRSRRVELTDSGRDILARVLVDHGEWQVAVIGGISKSEQRSLLMLLNKLTHHLSGIGSTDPTAVTGGGKVSMRKDVRGTRS